MLIETACHYEFCGAEDSKKLFEIYSNQLIKRYLGWDTRTPICWRPACTGKLEFVNFAHIHQYNSSDTPIFLYNYRYTPDTRFSSLHKPSSEHWVLELRDTQLSDQGLSDHTSYLSRTPRIYSCNFFLAGVNFYRFNAKNWHFRQILCEKVLFFYRFNAKNWRFSVQILLSKNFARVKKMTNMRYAQKSLKGLSKVSTSV